MQQISWLIGHTESRKEIRVYQSSDEASLKQHTSEFNNLDCFQSYAALDAYSLYVIKKYPDDMDYQECILKSMAFHRTKMGDECFENLKQKYFIRTSLDFCKFGRKFLMKLFVV